MKDKILEYLKRQRLKENKSCEIYTKSDDIELCRYSYVYPIDEMIDYMENDSLNDELLSYAHDNLSEL